jgi:hypothetical protein
VLSPTQANWVQDRKQKHEIYEGFKSDLIIKPSTLESANDHPLSTNNNSKWKQFYEDQELWEEIEKDVKRTRTDISLFWQAVDPA